MADASLDEALAAADPPGGRTRRQALVDLVLGTDPRIRPRTPLGLVAALLYLPVIILVNLYAVPSGAVSEAAGHLLTIYSLLGMLSFYPLVRSGFSQRFAEPSLSLPQMLYAEIGAVFLFHYFPGAKVTALQLLCVIQIFGLLRLSPPAAISAGICGILLLLASIFVSAHGDMFDPAIRMDLMTVGFEALVLIMLAALSSRYSRLRLDLERQGRDLADAVKQIRNLVTHDMLTGLYNRQHMQEVLERETQRSQRFGKEFCVALIDLDHFKQINDTHGHQVGDTVLCSFAEAARDILRETDVIARWGGEEFLALFPETEPSTAGQAGLLRLAQRLSVRHVAPGVSGLNLTFSAGIAAHHADESIEQTLERADKALYAAKAAGRNRSQIAE